MDLPGHHGATSPRLGRLGSSRSLGSTSEDVHQVGSIELPQPGGHQMTAGAGRSSRNMPSRSSGCGVGTRSGGPGLGTRGVPAAIGGAGRYRALGAAVLPLQHPGAPYAGASTGGAVIVCVRRVGGAKSPLTVLGLESLFRAADGTIAVKHTRRCGDVQLWCTACRPMRWHMSWQTCRPCSVCVSSRITWPPCDLSCVRTRRPRWGGVVTMRARRGPCRCCVTTSIRASIRHACTTHVVMLMKAVETALQLGSDDVSKDDEILYYVRNNEARGLLTR